MLFPLPGKAPSYTIEETYAMMDELDTDPLKNSGVRVVKPVGDGSSGIFFVGEAPGAKEDELGEPFVGASGNFFNKQLLPSVGLSRQNIYLTNIVKCRPPQNRDPLPEEKDAWSPVLLAEIIARKPKLIACLGRHSLGFFLPDVKIGKVHGLVHKVQLFEDLSVNVLALFHPAVALYNPTQAVVLKKDFEVIQSYLETSNPENVQTKQIVEKPQEADLGDGLF